jgi:hypothetical protein
MDGTVISDAVNLASRTEGLTKNYGVSLLITHQTFKRLQNPTDYAIRRIDEVKVKGKSEYVTIYEVFDADPPELKAQVSHYPHLLKQSRSTFTTIMLPPQNASRFVSRLVRKIQLCKSI